MNKITDGLKKRLGGPSDEPEIVRFAPGLVAPEACNEIGGEFDEETGMCYITEEQLNDNSVNIRKPNMRILKKSASGAQHRQTQRPPNNGTPTLHRPDSERQ